MSSIKTVNLLESSTVSIWNFTAGVNLTLPHPRIRNLHTVQASLKIQETLIKLKYRLCKVIAEDINQIIDICKRLSSRYNLDMQQNTEYGT